MGSCDGDVDLEDCIDEDDGGEESTVVAASPSKFEKKSVLCVDVDVFMFKMETIR